MTNKKNKIGFWEVLPYINMSLWGLIGLVSIYQLFNTIIITESIRYAAFLIIAVIFIIR